MADQGPRLQEERIGQDTLTVEEREWLGIAATHPEPRARAEAIEALGAGRKPYLRERFLDLLSREESSRVRQRLTIALMYIGEKGAERELIAEVQREADASVKLYLIGVLARYGNPVGYRYVVESLKSEVPVVQQSALRILIDFIPLTVAAELTRADPVGELLGVLRFSDPLARKHAVRLIPQALQRGGEPERLRLGVADLLGREPDPEIRAEAERALRAIEWVETGERERWEEEMRRRVLEDLLRDPEISPNEPPGR